jgi:hypothetical protein
VYNNYNIGGDYMGLNNDTKHINDVMNRAVAVSQSIATEADVNKIIPIVKGGFNYQNATFVDVKGMLGQVFIKREDADDLEKFIIPISAPIDEASILKTPLTKAEFIVNNKITTSANVLSCININLSADELLEVRVIENAAARVKDKDIEWIDAITKWQNEPLVQQYLDDPKIEVITVVVGATQRYFTTKKFKKFDMGAKGGGYGVNVEGNLYTSTSQFDLTVTYELDLATYFKSTSGPKIVKKNSLVKPSVELFPNYEKVYAPVSIGKVNELFCKSTNRFE